MNKQLILFTTSILMSLHSFSSSTDSLPSKSLWFENGKVYGKVFANFHSDLHNSEEVKAFEIKRAYFGYERALDKQFTANIKIDIGSPNDISEYSLKKRFAYFKNAYLQYQYKNLNLQFGIADCQSFKLLEKFWGYRYIEMSFQDKYKMGPSADIGFYATYKFNQWLSGDASVTNGEGYSTIQSDQDFKQSLGFTLTPLKFLTLRIYADALQSGKTQSTLASFIGLTFDKCSLGAEYNHQFNTNFNASHELYGYSFYSTVSVAKNIKVFGRFDHLYSNTPDAAEIPWNLASDGSALIMGIEYCPIKDVNFSLNYQDWVPYAENETNERFFYVNVQFSF